MKLNLNKTNKIFELSSQKKEELILKNAERLGDRSRNRHEGYEVDFNQLISTYS